MRICRDCDPSDSNHDYTNVGNTIQFEVTMTQLNSFPIKKVALCFSLLYVLVMGCNVTFNESWGLVTPIPTMAPATAEFVDAWLEDDSCPLPCWHGIQFGQTTVTEAIGILNDLPEISSVEIVTSISSDTLDSGTIYWTADTGENAQAAKGAINFDARGDDNGIVDYMSYTKGFVTLQDVFDRIGQPTHIMAHVRPCPNIPDCRAYQVTLFYALRGVRLQWGDLLEPVEEPEFHPLITDFDIDFFEPAWLVLDDEDIQEWRGFLDFESYCLEGICKKLR